MTFPQAPQVEQKKARLFLGGLWLNTVKDGSGRQYMSGYFGNNLQIQIWPNKNKKNDKAPDFNISLIESDPKAKDGAAKAGDQNTDWPPAESFDPPAPEDTPF